MNTQYLLLTLIFFINMPLHSMNNENTKRIIQQLNSLRNPRNITSYLDLLPDDIINETAKYYDQKRNIIPHEYINLCDCSACCHEKERKEQEWQLRKDSVFFAVKTLGVISIGCIAIIGIYKLYEYEQNLAATNTLTAESKQIIETIASNLPVSNGLTNFFSGTSAAPKGGTQRAPNFAANLNNNMREAQRVWQILRSRGVIITLDEVCAMVNAGINPLRQAYQKAAAMHSSANPGPRF